MPLSATNVLNNKNSLKSHEQVSLSLCVHRISRTSQFVIFFSFEFRSVTLHDWHFSLRHTSGARLTFAVPINPITRAKACKFRLRPTELILEWQKGWLRGEGNTNTEPWSHYRGERNEEMISQRYQTLAPIYDDLSYGNKKSCPGESGAKTAIHQAATFLFCEPRGRLFGGPPPKKDYYSLVRKWQNCFDSWPFDRLQTGL